MRALETWLSRAADAAWPLVRAAQARFPGAPKHPEWATGPVGARKRTSPPLGWPRRTDSLCPKCVKEVREAIIDGERPLAELLEGRPGEIPAIIHEDDGRIVMEKTCPVHGRFVDVLSIDPAFLARIERLFPGRDFDGEPTKVRAHGSSTIKYGRGAVLTVDLTNRCNMMCDPCFMDANQVGYVHELGLDDVKKILDDSITVRPRRQMSVQFSGGEPTVSPIFLDAIRHAKKVGYFAVQAATNGIEFAKRPDFCHEAKEAGLRMAYLQFDGIGNPANAHRRIGNLFDVKLRAIENLAAAKIDVILVVTVVRGVNDHEVGPILDFAVANADKITVVSFQPVSFTGRDEDIDDETRHAQRYTLSHLAHDVRGQTGVTEPLRDWFPLSAMGPFSDLVDTLADEHASFGSMKCGCHPNCGIGTVLLVNKRTKQMVPLAEMLDLDQLMEDVQTIADTAHPRPVILAETALALLRSFRPEKAPPGYGFKELVRQFLSQTGSSGVGQTTGDAGRFEWRALFVAGMWFQDLFNYDFRRTEMCVIPYGTQMGEISFCAYNTGVGFRQIVEKIHRTASTAEWFKTKGRHAIYAGGRNVTFDGLGQHSLAVPRKVSLRVL
jgi:hypothetical protein